MSQKKNTQNSMEGIECYDQTLIDVKEQYWKDVETFTKMIQLASNNMQLLLGAS
jgi:hypothetical protein